MRLNRRLATFAVTAITLSSCWGPGPREESFAVSAPLSAARVWGTDLFVRLSPGTPLSDVVAVPIDPLKPGMTITEAQRTIGEPLAKRSDAEGTFYLFRTEPQRIELAHLSGDASTGGRWESWSVAADRGAVSALFTQSIRRLIDRAAPVHEIVIHEHRRPARSGFSADLHDGELSRLRWYSIADLPE
jgi:hypothetical protein